MLRFFLPKGAAQSCYSLVILTMRVSKYFDSVFHALGMTSPVITILAAAPKNQSGNASKFVFPTFIDGTRIDGVGWMQRASTAHVAVIRILLAQYTLTCRKSCFAPSSLVFSSIFMQARI